MQFAIEAKELTNEYSHRPGLERETRRTIVEAPSADDAISEFVRDTRAELVSLTRPISGGESFATVRKDDLVLLVRVYAA